MAVVPRTGLTSLLADLINRRGSLRVLVALLLGAAAVTETGAADHPAHQVQIRQSQKRRKHRAHLQRRRTQQRRQEDRRDQDKSPGDWFTKGISILLRNPAAARSTPHIEVLWYDCPPFSCPVCRAKAVFDIAPGGPDRVFDTDLAGFSVVQINRRHMIGFTNPTFGRPYIKAWLASDDDLCHVQVTVVLDDYPMDEGESFRFAIDGHLFTVTRNADKSDFKYFTLDLATDL